MQPLSKFLFFFLTIKFVFSVIATDLHLINIMSSSSFKPYIIHAFYIWALENNYKPHLHIDIEEQLIFPKTSYPVSILKMHPESIKNLVFAKDYIFFNTNFDNKNHQIKIPYKTIRKIFCEHNSYGLIFDLNDSVSEQPSTEIEDNKEKTKRHLILVKNNNIENN